MRGIGIRQDERLTVTDFLSCRLEPFLLEGRCFHGAPQLLWVLFSCPLPASSDHEELFLYSSNPLVAR